MVLVFKSRKQMTLSFGAPSDRARLSFHCVNQPNKNTTLRRCFCFLDFLVVDSVGILWNQIKRELIEMSRVVIKINTTNGWVPTSQQ